MKDGGVSMDGRRRLQTWYVCVVNKGRWKRQG